MMKTTYLMARFPFYLVAGFTASFQNHVISLPTDNWSSDPYPKNTERKLSPPRIIIIIIIIATE
jgi:hypothetical protein